MKITLFVLVVSISVPVWAYTVIGVSDGDTLTLLVEQKPLKIRLANIDAPEKSQAFGERSKQSLSELCYDKDASYQKQDVDRYGRTVAIVHCAGVEANRAQVERGMAWVYEKYNHDTSLPLMEEKARVMRRGLWEDQDPLPPWEFRRARRERQCRVELITIGCVRF
jgi:micrococcal nuclease